MRRPRPKTTKRANDFTIKELLSDIAKPPGVLGDHEHILFYHKDTEKRFTTEAQEKLTS
jgi:hypothetical protein